MCVNPVTITQLSHGSNEAYYSGKHVYDKRNELTHVFGWLFGSNIKHWSAF